MAPQVLRYGGSTRLLRYNPYAVHYGHSMPLHSPEDLERLILPDPRNPSRWQDIAADSVAFAKAGIMPAGKIMGFFSGIHNSFLDFQSLMLAFFDHPKFVRTLTARLAEWSLACVEEMLARGVRLIEVCDDLGTPEGLLVAPETFEEYFLPWYRRLFELCHSRGAFVHMHSHGNIAKVLPMLVEAGVDILNPFDPHENPHLEEIIERFSDRVVFCGFSSSDYYLKSNDEIEAMFVRMAELGRKCKRGYIIMEHGFPRGTESGEIPFHPGPGGKIPAGAELIHTPSAAPPPLFLEGIQIPVIQAFALDRATAEKSPLERGAREAGGVCKSHNHSEEIYPYS